MLGTSTGIMTLRRALLCSSWKEIVKIGPSASRIEVLVRSVSIKTSAASGKKPVNFEDNKSFENVDIGLRRMETKYPQAHGTLKNIMSVVSRETGASTVTNTISFTYKPVGSKHVGGWSCLCHINWPEPMTFSSVGKTKTDASKMTSLKVLQWLMLQGKVKGNKPVLTTPEQATTVSSKKTNIHVTLDPSSVTKVNSLITKYQQEVLPLMEMTSLSENVALSSREWGEKKPLTEQQKNKMIRSRNALLQRRLAYRSEDETSIDSVFQQQQLPIYKFRNEIIQSVNRNQVVVIKGEPGCGKSTQVPQYILDQATKEGRACDVSVIVTQPRRISAVSLAQRVAEERGEQVGDTVGYQVRFQNRSPRGPGGSILFCSSGILLRMLQRNPNLQGVSHVVLDEAHERDVNTDMLMLLLKRVLANNPELKLVVMSATINPELFIKYYPGAVPLSIPGFTYPVTQHFLEDIKEVNLSQTKKTEDQKTPRLFHNEIADLLVWISRKKPPGAVLCFLPGWQDIKAVAGHLQKLLDPESHLVLPLHSRLSMDDQQIVFCHPPPGVRKIILSTNIAETSVTIDDVVYVVDTGVHKEERLSMDAGSAVLDNDWISQANVNQRRGRAGRVQPGESFHLYTRDRYHLLPLHPIPELHRVPLQKIVLDIKAYSEEEMALEFLADMPEPPSEQATECAVRELQDLGALTSEEALTSLGRRIARLSTAPGLSIALVHAVVFGCLDPMLTICGILSADADLFANTLEERAETAAVKRELSPFSDHLAVLNLYNQWAKLYRERQPDELFCIHNMLRSNTLRLVHRLRQLELEQLKECKMVPEEEDVNQSDFEHSPELLKGVLLSGTHSYLFQRSWDVKNGRIKLNSTSLLTESGHKASLSSDCVCHKQTVLPSPILVYYKKQESAARRTTIVRDASSVSPLALSIFLPPAQSQGTLSNSSDVAVMYDRPHLAFRIQANKGDAEIVKELQSMISKLVTYFVQVEGRPRDENYHIVSQFRDSLIEALSQLLNKSTQTTQFNTKDTTSATAA